MSKKSRAVIIGAGIGGLATANILAKAGYLVDVYEKTSAPGGRAGLLKKDGFQFDTGPSWYLMPEVFEHYYKLIGTDVRDHLDIIKLDPAYKVFFETEPPLTITTDPAKDQATFDAIEPGAGKALSRYVEKSSGIYDMALKHFLYTNFTSFRDLLHPDILRHGISLLRMAFTSMDSYTSRYVSDRRLKQVLEYTMVFLGASPYDAPAIYSLMGSLDFKHGVYYPRGGMYTVIESLVKIGESFGVQYHFGQNINKIRVENGQANGIELQNGEFVRADIVVSNADLHFTETQLLEENYQTYPEKYWQKRDAGPSALLLYVGVKGNLDNLEHHSLCFVDNWKENFDAIYHTRTIPKSASIYLSRATATDSNLAPKDHETLVILVPLPSGITISEAEQKRLAKQYIEQVARMTGVSDLPERVVSLSITGPTDFESNFNSWRATALGPSHTLRQSAFFRTGNKSKKVKNLYYVGGSTIPGIGLPMCLIGTELVYKHIIGDKRGGQVDQIIDTTRTER